MWRGDPKFGAKKFRYALLESQRELESQRLQQFEDNQWADQAQRERIHLWSELEVKNCLHQEYYAGSCQEFEDLKRCCYQEENIEKTTKDWKNFLRSMIRDHEQCVYWWIKYENYKNDW